MTSSCITYYSRQVVHSRRESLGHHQYPRLSFEESHYSDCIVESRGSYFRLIPRTILLYTNDNKSQRSVVSISTSTSHKPHRSRTSRPARPHRCRAAAFEIGATIRLSIPIRGLNARTFDNPVSTTYRMPFMVIEVSAILVASTTFRCPAGVFSKTSICF